MKESIYTIPVNEAFDGCLTDEKKQCPFCRLYKKLQENEIDGILGAAMMEPDIRIRTNKVGFCRKHFADMLKKGNRLSLALVLESHLDEINSDISGGDFLKTPGSSSCKRIEELEKSCYVCEKIEFNFEKMLETAVLLWREEKEFRQKTANQPLFCLPHYRLFIIEGQRRLNKKEYPEFYKTVKGVTLGYFEQISEDISWFCKKFDYRYSEQPWGNAKDAPERAIFFLSGDDEFDEKSINGKK